MVTGILLRRIGLMAKVSPVTVCQRAGIRKTGSTLNKNSDCDTDTLRVLAVNLFLIEALKQRY